MKRTIIFLFLLQAFTLTARDAMQPKPLSFIENKGQIVDQHGKHRSDIDFKAEAGGMVMFVGDAQLHYQWYRDNAKGKSENAKEDDIPLAPFKGGMLGFPFEGNNAKSPSGDLGVEVYRLDVELIGANKNAELITEGKQEYTENYYLPQCPDGATAHSYSRVIYKNVYPNIDWVIYTPQPPKGGALSSEGNTPTPSGGGREGVKYDFIVHPGGDYRDIQIRYNGATKIELKDGSLVTSTPFGSISENAPYTYDAETKKEITSKFVLNGNILSYNVVSHPGDGRGFVIDPTLGWATYYGGSGEETYISLTSDTAASAIIGGTTSSTANIATTGAYQTSFGGYLADPIGDGFIAKFSKTGSRLWATYYGGSNDDAILTVAADVAGNIYAGGTSSSSGMATTGAYQTTLINNSSGATSNGLLLKLNSSGQRLWSTYFGDTTNVQVWSMKCDPAGNIYFCGTTGNGGTGLLASSGAYQTTSSAPFIAKFSSSGSRTWCTYYNVTGVYDIMPDAAGNLYAVGSVGSAINFATAGAFQTSNGGNLDGFITKFNSTGSARLWSTYYGSTYDEWFTSIDRDAAGDIYVCGTVQSTGLATAGSHQPNYAGGNADGLLAKFSSTGTRLWATYYGGTNTDGISKVKVGYDGNIYIAGGTLSTTGIAAAGAYQLNKSPGGDVFFAQFSNTGTRQYATYYGGNNDDITGFGLSDPCKYIELSCATYGKVYISSTTRSTTGIATAGASQVNFAGGISVGDAFIVQFDADTAVYIVQPFVDTFKCVGDSLHVAYGVTQNFRSTNTFTLQLSNASGSFASPTTLATVSGGAPGTFHCIVPNVTNGTGYRIRVLATAPADTSDDNGLNIRIQSYPTTPVASANTPLCSGNTLNLASTNSTSGVVWSWAGPGSYTASTQNTSITNAQTTHSGDYIVTANLNGCVRKDTVTATINQTPAKPTVGSNTPLCSGNTLNLTASSTTSSVSWIWVGPNSWGSNQQNPGISNISTNGTGYYVATAVLGSCSSKDSTQVTVNPGPTINVYANPNDSVCAGSSITLVALVTNGGTSPSYQWYKNSSIISGATNSSYNTIPANGDVYYCKFTPGAGTGCNGAINSGNIPITVLPYTIPSINITAAPDTNIWQGLMVNFSATVSNCNNPAYQWKLNGNDVSGATSSTWGAATLADNNLVSCVLTCNDFCPNPKNPESNKLRMHVSTGINNTTNALSVVNIYPNPMHDELHIEGISKGTRIQLYDVLDREVYSTVSTEITHIISTVSLHTGTYILQLTDAAGNRGSYKIVRE